MKQHIFDIIVIIGVNKIQYRQSDMLNRSGASSAQKDLEYLLNCTGKQWEMSCLDVEPGGFQKLSKESTREEAYEDLLSRFHFARQQQKTLKQQYEILEAEAVQSYLGKHIQQLKQLSRENQMLRSLCRKENIDSKVLRQRTPKARRSINNVTFDCLDNSSLHSQRESLPRESLPTQRDQLSNMTRKKPTTQGKENIPSIQSGCFGRGSVHSPISHRRKENQLTERKAQNFNGSLGYCRKSNGRKSFQSSQIINNMNNNEKAKPNIFIGFLNTLLQEQKIYESELTAQIRQGIEQNESLPHFRVKFINELEDDIVQTKIRLEHLNLAVEAYQSEIEKMNVDVRTIHQFTSSLTEVKGKYIRMEQKCRKEKELRRELVIGERELAKLQGNNSNCKARTAFGAPDSVKLLCKILGKESEPNTISDFMKQLKKLLKGEFEKKQSQRKKLKVKQLIENMREGKKKFNQLLKVYEGRIAKMEGKISKFKMQKK